jgi:hypothetical protein
LEPADVLATPLLGARIGPLQRLRPWSLAATALPVARGDQVDLRRGEMRSDTPPGGVAVDGDTERRVGRQIPDQVE